MNHTREMRVGFPYGRARNTGGGMLMVFEFYATREECAAACVQRKEELQTPVNFFPVYLPYLDELKTGLNARQPG